MSLTVYIPNESVGAVIGRRGQTVAALQKTAAQSSSTHHPVRVSVVAATKEGGGQPAAHAFEPGAGYAPSNVNNNANSTVASSLTNVPAMSDYHTFTALDQSDPSWTPVVIRADAPAVLNAAHGLADLLTKSAPSASKGPTSLETMSSLLDHVILDVPLSRQKHATLIGKRGLTLATLSAESKVRIMIPQKAARLDLIQLEGDLLNVFVCLANVMRLLAAPSQTAAGNGQGANKQDAHNGNSSTSSSFNNNKSDTATSTTSTTTTVSLSSLPSQTKLRNIARKTDCQIRKQRKSNTLTITGQTLDQVQAAVVLLDKWQSAQQQQEDGGEGEAASAPNTTGNSNTGGGGNRNNRRGGNNRNRNNGKRNYGGKNKDKSKEKDNAQG
mmetsp:Transcript_7909/g.17576  ORF Transcript_7909/g.17576 Transcript_7909/m.17576 type:complete len:384 (-) Transcript_7909:264-1415(-)